jgi:hypothetical protein
MIMTRQETIAILSKGLLDDEEMDRDLYEERLERRIDEWHQGLKSDRENYVFVVTKNSSHMAMVMITKSKKVYVNEEAKEKLSQVFLLNYKKNIELLLPKMAGDFEISSVSVNGIFITNKPKRRRPKNLGFGV